MERDDSGHVQPSSTPAGTDALGGSGAGAPEPPETSTPKTQAPDAEAPASGARDTAAAGTETAPAGTSAEAAPTEELEGHHLLELWSDREEIHALPEILRPAEGLVAVGSGTVVKSARLAQANWLVVLTDRRLLCIKGRSAVTRKVIDMPISQIRGVETKGWFRKTMSLDTGYGTLRISGMKKSVAQEMVEGLTALMGAYADDGGGESATAIPKADLSKAGTRGQGHTHEELHELTESVETLRETISELTERVAFLEELVRSNVGSSTGPREGAE